MYLHDLDTVGDLMSLHGEGMTIDTSLEIWNRRRNPTIVRSYAPLLFSKAIASVADDALDELEIIQKLLPKMLASMPERKAGDRNRTLDTLLGPPQYTAGIRLVEVMIYLCSNSLLPSDDLVRNQAMHWVADHVSLQNMRNLLRNQSPTLQAFRFQLLRFGLRTGREDLVKDVLHTDDGLKKFVLRSTSLLSDTIRDNNVAMTKLLLKFGLDVLGSKQFARVKARLLRDCQSIAMANLLSQEVAVTVSRDASVRHIGDSALLSAIRRRDPEMVRFLIEAGSNVDVFVEGNWGSSKGFLVDDTWGRFLFDERWGNVTALSLAISSGQMDILRLILEGNADVHVQTKCDDQAFQPDLTIEELATSPQVSFIGTALQAAAARGHSDMVQLLLQKGSNVNEPLQGPRAMTALQAAVHFGHVETAKILLEHGADTNAPATSDEPSRTALLTATTGKSLVMVKLLLDFGAEVEPLSGKPETIALMAVIEEARAQGESLDLLQALQSGNEELVNEASGSKTQLCHAIQRGDMKGVLVLMNSGACIDVKPVDEACWLRLPRDDDLMEDEFNELWLRPRRLGQVRSSSERATMLHMSITSGDPVDSSLFIFLYEKMIRMGPYQMEDHLEPLLHTAVRWRRFDAMDFLISSTDIDIPACLEGSRLKVTALSLAARSNDVEIATMLLERGANANSTASGDVQFPLENALRQRHLPTAHQNFIVAKILLNRGAAVDTAFNKRKDMPLQIAAEDGNLEIMRALLQYGAPVNHYWKCNQTPLMAATLGEHFEAVKLLLDNGADANLQLYDYGLYSDHGSALQYAARSANFAISQLLLERGGNINTVGPESTMFGRTPLETAAMYGALDIVQLFLNAGADSHLPPRIRYARVLRIAKEDYFEPNFGVVKLLEGYRQEALDEWNSARILELDS